MRNVEIKAYVKNLSDLITRAKSLSDSSAVIHQFDTFFNVPQGRLKLREFKDGNAELIYYERSDMEGPKLSSYKKSDLNQDSAASLKDVLHSALGSKGAVQKVRNLYMIGQTRVHVDSVDSLGDFVELEVGLSDNETVEQGESIAKDLMKKLNIEEADLISGAYMDMLLKK